MVNVSQENQEKARGVPTKVYLKKKKGGLIAGWLEGGGGRKNPGQENRGGRRESPSCLEVQSRSVL